MNSLKAVVLVVEDGPIEFDTRMKRIAQSLGGAGYEVIIVSPEPEDGVDGYSEYKTVRFHRPDASGGVGGYIFEYCVAAVSIVMAVAGILLRRKVDVLHVAAPPDTNTVALSLFRVAGIKLVHDQHDLSPELVKSKWPNCGRTRVKLVRSLEWLACKVSHSVIATNSLYEDILTSRNNLASSKIRVVRNAPDPSRIFRVDIGQRKRDFEEESICYVGNMNEQDGLDYLVKAISYCVNEKRRDDVYVICMGDGPAREVAERLASDLGVEDSISFTGRVADQTVRECLSQARAGVAPDPDLPLNRVSTMNKVMEYMQMKLPVVCFNLPEMRNTVGGGGLYATPNDVEEFGDKMLRLWDDDGLAAELGTIGYERVTSQLSWERQSEALLKAYTSLFCGKVCETAGRE